MKVAIPIQLTIAYPVELDGTIDDSEITEWSGDCAIVEVDNYKDKLEAALIKCMEDSDYSDIFDALIKLGYSIIKNNPTVSAFITPCATIKKETQING